MKNGASKSGVKSGTASIERFNPSQASPPECVKQQRPKPDMGQGPARKKMRK